MNLIENINKRRHTCIYAHIHFNYSLKQNISRQPKNNHLHSIYLIGIISVWMIKFKICHFFNISEFGIHHSIVIFQVGVIKYSFVCTLHQKLQNNFNYLGRKPRHIVKALLRNAVVQKLSLAERIMCRNTHTCTHTDTHSWRVSEDLDTEYENVLMAL